MSGLDYVCLEAGDVAAPTQTIPFLGRFLTGAFSLLSLSAGFTASRLRLFSSFPLSSSSSPSSSSPSHFFPVQGLDHVLIRPGPPPLSLLSPSLLTSSSSSSSDFCLFLYGAWEGKLPKSFAEGAHTQPAWLYGASLTQVAMPNCLDGLPNFLAEPTGRAKDVVKGRLVCWRNNSILKAKLHVADKVHDAETSDPTRLISGKRRRDAVVCEDGTSIQAYWYCSLSDLADGTAQRQELPRQEGKASLSAPLESTKLSMSPEENVLESTEFRAAAAAEGISSLEYSSRDGTSLQLLWLRPVHAHASGKSTPRPPSTGRAPMLVFFHGGGWVLGDFREFNHSLRLLQEDLLPTRSMVFSVQYRLAPRHKFPTAHNDAEDAVRWLVANAAKLGGDPERVVLIGESAGGNLAAGVAHRLRADPSIRIRAKYLTMPVIDCDFETESYVRNAVGGSLTKKTMFSFWKIYAKKDQWCHPDLAVLRRPDSDFIGLPPSFVAASKQDPLFDEGTAYAQKLQANGVPTLYQSVDHPHASHFQNAQEFPEESRQARQAVVAWLQDLLQ
eukprot:gb/GEZN01003845.1/.p1 GENE.gb/GEZN01003845.1/~~gb/GEZN01003845.1/.p1  ORF type:complete len:577 (+),score=91.73 gb/GEZN01003845.1/:64-1731(+)